uniref:Uncharacterized protein n=1 Tax=Romanomermis culicivorax TaxID=13658 RepID=A0A915IWK0_ROMCU
MGDKPVHLFTTELANQAIQVVKIDRFQNIVAFHCSLEETKRFLSNFAQVQQNSQNSLPKQQNIGSLDGGKLGGCTNDMQGQILAPATTSGGRKFAPPPNVKLENPFI